MNRSTSPFPSEISQSLTLVAPGVWKLQVGTPESHSPFTTFQPPTALDRVATLPVAESSPIDPARVYLRTSARGAQIHLPLAKDENIYGLGLQLLSFNQKGLKKTLRVNSDPRVDLGDSHAPAPFYVTTSGYGVLVDTSRYASFYCGSSLPPPTPDKGKTEKFGFELGMEALYAVRDSDRPREMVVDIPGVEGANVYIFAGPTLLQAIQRYNLFSGGGCVPPRWALGTWYRARSDFSQAEALAFAKDLRKDRMPCDVFGLEPGWQSRAYACSHVWNEKFPDPAKLISDLKNEHFEANLWTHAFTHTDSPIFESLAPHSGDTSVFGGIIPDFLKAEARELFIQIYREQNISIGVSGFKLDECDNSDFIPYPWSFPEWTQFPSGVDGEQMHSLFGTLFQQVIREAFETDQRRTFGLVRNSHAFAAPLPFVLYSDLYDHREFVRGIVSAAFSGMLWCPEIREASSGKNLLRRLQSGVASPMLQINAWYIKNAPWKQWDVETNNRDELLPDAEEWTTACRSVLELRMQLIPYLQAAFYQYWKDGIPPFRALVTDYPGESESWGRDDQILMGDRLMAAPLIGESATRSLWFPPGEWIDFWTGKSFAGNTVVEITAEVNQLPLFVKANSILPLAVPTLHTSDPDSFQLQVRIYGDGSLPITLIEEKNEAAPFDAATTNLLTLSWTAATEKLETVRLNPDAKPLYSVTSVEKI